MNDYILFVDTETSGLPKNWNKPNEQWPYIIQVAWVVYDKEGNEIKRESHYIWDEKITIDPKSEEVHGISKDLLLNKGEKRVKVLKMLFKDIQYYNPLLVGHLIEFDKQMLSVGFLRAGLKNILYDYPSYCTMRSNAHYMRLSNHTYPKLNELYWSLFKEPMADQHNALSDCLATAACFFELIKRKEITDEVLAAHQKTLKKKSDRKNKTGCGLPVLLIITFTVLLYCFGL